MITAQRIIDEAIRENAAYVHRPPRQGGPKKYGITLGMLRRHRGHPVTDNDLRYLRDNEARDIYYRQYYMPFSWIRNQGALGVVVDMAITYNIDKAIKILQRAAGVNATGVIGDDTKKAALNAGESLYTSLVAEGMTAAQ